MPPSKPEQPFIKRWALRLFAGKKARQPEPASAPKAVPAAPDCSLFDDWTLPLTPALKKRIKTDVAKRLPANAQPTAAQWKMIFSRTPATQVVAGAGSGKSTSLVLRLLVLHHYLGYELNCTTVITFTREARNDFIKKMLQLFDLWELGISDHQAAEVVRTFHSRLLPMVRSLPGMAGLVAFETMGNAAPGAGNPFDLRINDAQRNLLNQAYSSLLSSEPDFGHLVAKLRLQVLQLSPLSMDHPEVRKRLVVTHLAAERDEELSDLIEDHWYRAGAWPIQGIEPERKVLAINGSEFHCHGHIAELDAYVVLGLDPGLQGDITRKGAKLPVRAEWAVKRTLFRAFCDKPLIWIESYEEGRQLWGALAGSASAGPGFAYQVMGDLAPAPLLDSFFASACFIENLGLDVAQAIEAMDTEVLAEDMTYFQALALYWPAFNRVLRQQDPPVMTYNAMFSTLGEQNTANLAQVPDTSLKSMTHLMIDEFQDISPQIVGWVRACLREVRRRGAAQQPQAASPTSLLCVGDDWQSIYGWRGSAAHYFLQFKHEFPAPSSTRVLLGANFRSQQPIIDAAEHMVRSVRSLPGKKGTAVGEPMEPLVPVQVLERDDKDLARRIDNHYQRGDSILILFRRSADKLLIIKEISDLVHADSRLPAGQRRLRLLTYHSAKGLQAEAVFLVGDCVYSGRSPYRNEAYRLAGLAPKGQVDPYDAAQRDEILRLAYVAITRAARHCYWYLDASKREPAEAVKASSKVSGNEVYFTDLRPGRG